MPQQGIYRDPETNATSIVEVTAENFPNVIYRTARAENEIVTREDGVYVELEPNGQQRVLFASVV